MAANLTPEYQVGCKRILFSSAYYPALALPNAEIIPDAIRECHQRASSPSTATERAADAIIFATGFHVTDGFESAASAAPAAN